MNPSMLAAWLVSAWLLLLPSLGNAQPANGAAKPSTPDSVATSVQNSDRARDVASKHFRRAVELFQEAAYGAALVEFERAYETLPDYRLHYNIAQTKRLLQDYVGATQSYERYLSDGGAAVSDARRTEVTEQLRQLKERVARLAITASEDSVRIYVDDRLVGITPMTEPIDVNVGQHRVVGRSSAGVESVKVVDVAGGDVLPVFLPVQAVDPQRVTTVVEEEPRDRTGARRFAIASMAIGGASMAGAIAAGIIAAVEQNNFDKAKKNGNLSAAQRHKDRTERSALATDVLGFTGLALTVTGIVTWFAVKPAEDARPAASRKSLRLGVGPGSLAVRGTF